MKIEKVTLEGLNGNTFVKEAFHPDINVLTGANGTGKTTLLKAIWYVISSNAERLAPEINFRSMVLETDQYIVTIERQKGEIRWKFSAEDAEDSGKYKEVEELDHTTSIERLNRLVQKKRNCSLYFPTFRRIEGGYSMGARRVRRRMPDGYFLETSASGEIQRELEALSRRISVDNHRFISSISTDDIASLITRKYAEISEGLNSAYEKFTTSIMGEIQTEKRGEGGSGQESAVTVLNNIQVEADRINDYREKLLRPFTVLSELSVKLFRHRGIRVQGVTFGQSVDAIDSASLSAGEKQLLSFICYNAFVEDAVVFIDEPELSLHPDWQRRLFGTLMKQQPSNQFIVATHSPFIYTKFEDKEIVLSEDKGA